MQNPDAVPDAESIGLKRVLTSEEARASRRSERRLKLFVLTLIIIGIVAPIAFMVYEIAVGFEPQSSAEREEIYIPPR
jgi:hypothetical protein